MVGVFFISSNAPFASRQSRRIDFLFAINNLSLPDNQPMDKYTFDHMRFELRIDGGDASCFYICIYVQVCGRQLI